MRHTLIFGLVLWTGTARAASLDDFLSAAQQHNPDVAAAAARYDRSRAGVDVARSALLPSVSATGTYQRNFPEVVVALPGAPEELVITPADQLGGQGTLTVPLLVPSAVASTHAAAAQARADASGRDLATEGVLLSVVSAYYSALATAQVEEAAKASVEAATRSMELASARAELDAASDLDLRRAEADLARAQQLLLSAEAERRKALRALETLTGLSELPDSENAPRPVPQGDLDARAQAANPQIHQAEKGLQAARLQARAAGLMYSPTLSGFGNVNLTNATGFSGQAATGNAGLRVSWNLLDGGAREGRWAQARATAREAEARLEGLQATIADDVAAAEDAVRTTEASVEAATTGVAASREALRLAEERYALGDLDTNLLTMARRDAFDAEVQAARARLAAALAVEQLRILVGESLVVADERRNQ